MSSTARAGGRRWPVAALLLLAGLFVALGVWQLERREWKHELIAAVDARAHAAPVQAPGPAQWPRITADSHAYLNVRAAGRYLPGQDSFVQAVTALGGGYWLLTPLQTADGVILINRGFVPKRAAPAVPTGEVSVSGLLRLTEPNGGFLRRNDPATGRWYSRDVAAIAAAHGLSNVAPYFIDAARDPAAAPGDPVGGLTVIRFSDNHMSYALTWFAMALMSLGGAFLVWRRRI
ncbi:SURF1 family protein [Sandaracinobacter neustonicus]|uniref:SURF1-like protein n=1 Tax=Sandaracinobacter neustonicus TaxID=1715348 RepID=A0A501XX36_9SPHN|nr:SURF1 family cytochrome oxidase biogenesis protein [Sandaracinobacter neustonicus]TPE65065.1 SURF1 family protein [Sandaracinobacter neustonicus]